MEWRALASVTTACFGGPRTCLSGHSSAGSFRSTVGRSLAWLVGIARNVVSRRYRLMSRGLEVVRRVDGRALVDDDAPERLR